MTTETQGITDKDSINQDKNQTQSIELESPKAGTATSSPSDKMSSQSNKDSHLDKMVIPNVMIWMMKNAHEQTTIKKVAKLLRHLERNCDTTNRP